jgi:hypothetical protein
MRSATKFAAICFCLVLLLRSPAHSAESPTLQITGQVLLPGGSPASGARLWYGVHGALTQAVEANDDGRFAISDAFNQQTTVVVQDKDRALQAELLIPTLHARTMALQPLSVQLQPAVRATVRVVADGKPVAGALVKVENLPAEASVADASGEATLLLGQHAEGVGVLAWHPKLGVAAGRCSTKDLANAVELTLEAPKRRPVKLIDQAGRPAVGVGLFPSFQIGAGAWFAGKSFPLLKATTSAAGEAEWASAPAATEYCDLALSRSDWLLEQVDQAEGDEPVIGHVRKKREIRGKLVVPEGCNPTGLLIAGCSFGPKDRFDIASTRVAADGSFRLQVAPEHCYVLAVCDSQWASEPIMGVFARDNSAEIEPLPELKVYPASPVEVEVLIGPDKLPLANHYVLVSRPIEMEWKDANGKRRSGSHAISHWLKTDADGRVRTGVGRGAYDVSTSHEKWRQTHSLVGDAAGPLAVTLHKPYVDKRAIAGRLVPEPGWKGKFEDTRLRAVAGSGPAAEIKVDAAGEFVHSTDSPRVVYFAQSGDGQFGGRVAASETDKAVTLALQPTGTYSGQLVGSDGQPVPNTLLTLSIQEAAGVFPLEARTDEQGQFRFETILTGVPLRLVAEVDGRRRPVTEHFFEPGEQRAGVRVRLHLPSDPVATTKPPLRERIDVAVRDARLASMRVLLIASQDTERLRTFVDEVILDGEVMPAIYEYQPLSTTVEELGGEDNQLWKSALPSPGEGQVALAVLDETGKPIGTARLSADSPHASEQVRAFLERGRPKVLTARELWDAALQQAKESNRRVLLQFGGPRCGPCFLFSRWIDRHHAQLDRDYVWLKLHPSRHVGAAEIEAKLRSAAGGIPWTAILNADEKLLATSDGPLGNFGYPGQFESVRQFRRMLEETAQRLTKEEIAELAATLQK